MKAKLDKILSKLISRKLSVFIVACFFIGFGSINSADWTLLALVYIGGQTVIDMVKAYKA